MRWVSWIVGWVGVAGREFQYIILRFYTIFILSFGLVGDEQRCAREGGAWEECERAGVGFVEMGG